MDEPAIPRIVIVDDDPVIRRLLQLNFRLEGFAVELAARGEEALTLIGASPPDAVVLDITMPDLDGWEVGRRLRAMPGGQQIPVVFLSARSRVEDGAQATSMGADYLSKPFDPIELVSLVRDALAKASA